MSARFLRTTLITVGCLLLGLAPARSALAASLLRRLESAVALYDNLDFDHATDAFENLLKESPPPRIEARALIYLGLIQLENGRVDRARAYFTHAVSTDPSVDLPLSVSPKARRLLESVLREAVESSRPQAPTAPTVVSVPPSAPPTTTVEVNGQSVGQPAPLWPALTAGGVAAAALAAGIALGLASNNDRSQAMDTLLSYDARNSAAHAGQAMAIGADISFGAAAALAATGVILFFFTRHSATQPPVAVGPVPGGAAVAVLTAF